MGLGKTVQVIAALRVLCIQRQVESVLVVVPASLLDQWRREVGLWAPELRALIVRGPTQDRTWQWRAPAHVLLVSYETLRVDLGSGSESPLRTKLWDVVVLDEAQRIKNSDAETSRAVKCLRRKRSWALTGTPLENRVEDLLSILEFVDMVPQSYSPASLQAPYLLARHRDLQLRRRKSEVMQELPPKHVIELIVGLSQHQEVSYREAETTGVVQLREFGEKIKVEHVLALITRLKQICNFDPRTGDSSKLEEVADRMQTLVGQGHRALVFSQFTDSVFGVEAIAKRLAAFEPLLITGAQSPRERDEVIADFKREQRHKVLVLSLKAGGVGLNLQDATYVFLFDRWWNPAWERQAEDRAHRFGQIYPVTVFKFVCTSTIEERIQAVLASKELLFKQVVDDVCLDLGTTLNRRELLGLFGLATEPRLTEEPPRDVTGVELEQRCAALLAARGWSVDHTPKSYDGGIDLMAGRVDEVGIAQQLLVQCKDHSRPVGVDVVRELLGVLPPGRYAQVLLVSTSGVTIEAAKLARERGVLLWDEATLRRLEDGGEREP